MDLLALRKSAAFFDPFTALIGLNVGTTRDVLALSVPVIEKPSASHYSLLFHEVTHLWSMRTSLLGCVLSVAAAKAWDRWQKASGGLIAPRAVHLLATFLPILEGLACYAELDYEADEDEDVIHSPVVKVAQLVSLSMNGMSNRRLFTLVRQERLLVDHLLQVLLLEQPVNPREHAYLSGYLYVKAVAQRFRLQCPRLARPSTMLALLVRVFCEHPVMLKSQLEDLTSEEILTTLHRAVMFIDAATLTRIADYVDRGIPDEVVWKFDFLDVHASQARGELTFSDDSCSWYHALNAGEAEQTFVKLRGAGSTYLPEWESGVLERVDPGAVVLRCFEHATTYNLHGPADFERMRDESPFLQFADEWQNAVLARLRGAIGHNVTIALYLDLASGDPGMAFWKDEQLLAVSPYSLSWLKLEEEERRERLHRFGRGLALPPTMRWRFGEAVRTPAAFDGWVASASRLLLAQLASSTHIQEQVLQSKFAALDNGVHNAALAEWAEPNLKTGLAAFPAAIAARFSEIFDCPGFAEDAGNIRFDDLMPRASGALGP